MRRRRGSPLIPGVAVAVLWASCVPPEARDAGLARGGRARLLARPIAGLTIVPAAGGGRARPVSLGALSVCPEGRAGDEAGDGFTCLYAECAGGGAGGGVAGGAHGWGGGGGGRGAESVADGPGPRATGVELEPEAFAWAELELPYREGHPARFPARPGVTLRAPVETSGPSAALRSTFAVDVDTASYSMVRRALASGALPEPSVVRVEEFLNFFRYDYRPPTGPRELFAVEADGARSPAEPSAHLLRVGLQAPVLTAAHRLPANLVFLVDTSCSMTAPDRLPLAKESIGIALDHLAPSDSVAITTYAGGVSVVLPPTPVRARAAIDAAVARLAPGGATAMASGLELAYRQAARLLDEGSNTRIIVLSDGDANLGATSPDAMLRAIAGYVSEGVRLSTIGFGAGNYRDAVMEALADRGNGNYYYVDSRRQAERVFGRDLQQMIQDVAEDVKVQVEFDPRAVADFRLVGYENRALADRDFRDDRRDAGEIGAGHQVTALYALHLRPGVGAETLATVRVRAKRPRGRAAKELVVRVPVGAVDRPYSAAPDDLQTAIAVMGAAELLRQSPHALGWTWARVLELVEPLEPTDADHAELGDLVRRAAHLAAR